MRHLATAVVLLCVAVPLQAKEVEVQALCTANAVQCQKFFQHVAEDVITLVDYKAAGPAEATGISGIGVGAVVSYVDIGGDNSQSWQAVTGQEFSGLALAGLQVTKGLPLDIDVGAFYATVPDTNVDVYGGELRYAIMAGSTTTPALAVRASHVKTAGIEDFELDSTAAELALSKGFGPITPFVGAGYVWGKATPDASTGLQEAKVEDSKAYVGVRLSAGLFEITPQVGTVGDTVNYALRLGFSF